MEKLLNLQKEYLWEPGVRQDYNIVSPINDECVGQLSITRFALEMPFVSNWSYLNKIEIEESKRRQGWGFKTMLEINEMLKEEGRNGVLKNSIQNIKMKNFYDQLGWIHIESIPKKWQFIINQSVSTFLLNKVVNEIVKGNFTK